MIDIDRYTLIELSNFFILGLTGGFGHCIFMCHPFVLYISSRFTENKKGYSAILKPQIKYNLGRIITYTILGMVISYIGDIVNAASSLIGVQKLASILAGLLLTIYGLYTILGKNLLYKIESKLTDFSKNLISKLDIKSPFIFGLILGFLPCGFLYGALIYSFGLASISKSFFSMIAFGLGTTIPLLVFSIFGSILLKKFRIFSKISAIILILMGLYFILRAIYME
ncbi:MAG: sulfite exporter TauE/SafE family protein [Deferribacterales bacterium]